MQLNNLIDESKRVMRICNACRYCEGFCAVFPAMELRRTFTTEDMKYMANLCHDCRSCYYACQYAPPHEFDLNVPKTFSALRLETYKEFAGDGFKTKLFNKNGAITILASLLSAIFIFVLVLLFKGSSPLFSTFTGENSFYNVLPYGVMITVFILAMAASIVSMAKGISTCGASTGMGKKEIFNLKAHIQAMKDVVRLRYLDGGGDGCNYPDDRFRKGRKKFHHFVFYGFILCFISTSLAFFYDHFLHLPAPYSFFSLPVIFGTIGGFSIVIGSGGFFYLKLNMDKEPSEPLAQGMDTGFTVLIFLTAFSGLMLLFLRDTPLMGSMLVIHLALVLAFFIMLPCGKFVHAVYRYMALVKNSIEQDAAEK